MWLFRNKKLNNVKKISADKLSNNGLLKTIHVSDVRQRTMSKSLKINYATRKENMFSALTLSLSKILNKEIEKSL